MLYYNRSGGTSAKVKIICILIQRSCKSTYFSLLFSSTNTTSPVWKHQQQRGCPRRPRRATAPSRQRQPSLPWRKVILISFSLFSPPFSPRGTTHPGSPIARLDKKWKRAVIYCGRNAQPHQQPPSSNSWMVRHRSPACRATAPTPNQAHVCENCHYLNVIPSAKHFSRSPKITDVNIPSLTSVELLFLHHFFPLKCSPICNTQDRTNFCPSKTVVTAVIFTRAIKFQTGWIIFVPGRKNIWPSSGPRRRKKIKRIKKKAGFIVLYPFQQHTVALLGW